MVAGADGQAGSYLWTVTGPAGESCLVRISSGALSDTSARAFWIINPKRDTDGDGFTDQEEVDGGTNPFDRKSKPPVMFHGRTGCGFAATEGSPAGFSLLVLIALAGWSLAARREESVKARPVVKRSAYYRAR